MIVVPAGTAAGAETTGAGGFSIVCAEVEPTSPASAQPANRARRIGGPARRKVRERLMVGSVLIKIRWSVRMMKQLTVATRSAAHLLADTHAENPGGSRSETRGPSGRW